MENEHEEARKAFGVLQGLEYWLDAELIVQFLRQMARSNNPDLADEDDIHHLLIVFLGEIFAALEDEERIFLLKGLWHPTDWDKNADSWMTILHTFLAPYVEMLRKKEF